MAKPKILIVYKEKDSLTKISKLLALLKYFWLGNTEEAEELPLQEIKEGDEYDIRISTKYYEADLQVINRFCKSKWDNLFTLPSESYL